LAIEPPSKSRVEPLRTKPNVQTECLLNIETDDGIVVHRDGKPMSDDSPVLRKGPFKGKRIEFAPTAGIETFQEIAEDFMLNVFGFESGDYLITDLSSLDDFVGVDDMELGDMLTTIRDVYGLDVADLPNGNLLEIFRRLHEQRADDRSRNQRTQ
jgi:hypothetical protein